MAFRKKGEKGTLITEIGDGDEDETRVNILKLDKHYHFKRGDFLVSSKGLYRYFVEIQDKLTGLDFKLFNALYARTEAGNRIRAFSQKEIGEIIHTNQPNVSNSLKKFIELGIIEKDGLEYYFSDKYVWTGGRKNSKKSQI